MTADDQRPKRRSINELIGTAKPQIPRTAREALSNMQAVTASDAFRRALTDSQQIRDAFKQAAKPPEIVSTVNWDEIFRNAYARNEFETVADIIRRSLEQWGPVAGTGAGTAVPITSPVHASSVPNTPTYEQFAGLTTSLLNDANRLTEGDDESETLRQLVDALPSRLQEFQDAAIALHLQRCLSAAAYERLAKKCDLSALLFRDDGCQAFVLALDIRRSTDLMLKAISADRFAQFMTTIATMLAGLVKENLGFFDKFTGDGILAFFPEFLSGDDAGFRAIKVAALAHEVFETYWKASWVDFTVVPSGVGLGIGIDYGRVDFVRIVDSLTAIGQPVVYACRLSSADAGQTLLNQQAYAQLSRRADYGIEVCKTSIPIPHESPAVVYKVDAYDGEFQPRAPDWWDDVNDRWTKT